MTGRKGALGAGVGLWVLDIGVMTKGYAPTLARRSRVFKLEPPTLAGVAVFVAIEAISIALYPFIKRFFREKKTPPRKFPKRRNGWAA